MARIIYPINDKRYTAEDVEIYNIPRTSGVYAVLDFDCSLSGDTLTIGKGLAWIKNGEFSGKTVAFTEPETLTLEYADDTYDRYDVVAIRYDATKTEPELVVKKGVASASPELPARSTETYLYELYLYSILREKGEPFPLFSNITDLRRDKNYCGIMRDSVTSVVDVMRETLYEDENGAGQFDLISAGGMTLEPEEYGSLIATIKYGNVSIDMPLYKVNTTSRSWVFAGETKTPSNGTFTIELQPVSGGFSVETATQDSGSSPQNAKITKLVGIPEKSQGYVAVDSLYNPESHNAQSGEAVKQAIDEALENFDFDVPENVETTDNKVTKINKSSTDEQYPSAKAVYGEVAEITSALFDVVSVSTNFLNTEEVEEGQYMVSSGEQGSNPQYNLSGYIPVKAGEILTMQRTRNWGTGNVREITSFVYLAAFDENKVVLPDYGGKNYNPYIVPDGVHFIRVTYTFSDKYTNYAVCKSAEIIPFEEYGGEKKIRNNLLDEDFIKDICEEVVNENPQEEVVQGFKTPFLSASGNIADGEYLYLAGNIDVKKNINQMFFAKFTEWGDTASLTVGHGETEFMGTYVVIDATNITVHYYNGNVFKRAAHGLDFADFISVNIVVNKEKANVTVATSSGSYTLIDSSWYGCNGKIFAKSNGLTLNDCKLSWTSADLLKDVWVFGDSYLNLTDPTRFMYYVSQQGYDEFLACGYGGASSKAQYNAFVQLLNLGTPKYAVWTLGMNDPDNGAINNNYKTYTGQFITKCEENNIIPVISTIPSCWGSTSPDSDITLTRDNSYKNEWVKSSGYRYIDFADAVEKANGGWYDDMLSSDGVHPTRLGAVTLSHRFIRDFPEIATCKNIGCNYDIGSIETALDNIISIQESLIGGVSE